jgi:RHS repeat-associated protein
MANPVCAVHTTLYDAAGNVTADNANNYLYDGEGRICAVQDRTFGGMTQYIYDAEGTRVAKGGNTNLNAGCDTSGPTFALTNTYIIGPSGEQLTETDGNGNWVHTNVYAAGQLLATYSYTDNSHAATDTYFALSDWLGTKRAVVSAGGCGTGYVGLPYGDSLTATNLPGFTQCPDATEHHFTGKERDAESGNDYFGARYYASSMGRFMSPDWSAKEEPVPYAKLDNPQTLNLYAYVRNNSLSRFDADGHESAWDLAKKWLNVVEVKIGVSAGVGTSGQWGVAKYEGHATLIGVEANTALAGAGMDSKLVTGVHGSLSAGPAKATIGAGGELSAANGPSATANANASLGPAQASASASADSSGVHTGASATLNGPEMHEDSKVAGSITFGATVGVGINLTQAGTAWDSTVQDVRAVGAYLNNLLPSSPMSWPTAPPIIPTQ